MRSHGITLKYMDDFAEEMLCRANTSPEFQRLHKDFFQKRYVPCVGEKVKHARFFASEGLVALNVID